jgi:two-component system, cell cycle response regulator DivK
MTGSHAVIIDDHWANIDVLGRLLAQEGITHNGISSPASALEIMDQLERVDVIFLDLELPNCDPLVLRTQLKHRFAASPIIAYTVHTSYVNYARQAGFDGFLGKPVSTLDFPNNIWRILSGESIWEF